MEEENIEHIDNLSYNFSNEQEINDDEEEEMKPIPEIFDEKEFNIEDNFKEDKKEKNENNPDNKINENFLLKESLSLNEDEKVEFFPIDYLIPTEEINSIDININSKDQINIDDNENEKPSNNNFF